MMPKFSMCTCKWILLGVSVVATLVLGLYPFSAVPSAWGHAGDSTFPGAWFVGKVAAVLIPIGIYGILGVVWYRLILPALRGQCPSAESTESQ